MVLAIGILLICIPQVLAYMKYRDARRRYQKRMAEIHQRLEEIDEERD